MGTAPVFFWIFLQQYYVAYSAVLRSRSIFDRLRVFFWPAPAPALVKKYALKKLKKMNNSTSCSRKNTFLRISFLFVHVRMQEQNRVQSVWNKNTVNFKKVKLYLQYQYLQVVSSVNFWGTFLKFNFSSMVEPEPEPVEEPRLRNTDHSHSHSHSQGL